VTPGLSIERRDSIVHVTLDDPENGNAVTEEMGMALTDLLLGLGAEARLVVLRGAGNDFCLGRRSPPIDRKTATAIAFRHTIADGPLRLYNAFRSCRAPILGLVRGRAAGVGCALAALCDVTLASEDAVFSVPEMDHGIPPTLVISALSGRVPYKGIAHLVLTGLPVTASRAEALGIVGAVLPGNALEDAVEAVVARLERTSSAASQGVKEFLRVAAALEPQAQSSLASSIIANVLSSQNR
jgi:enoyl-CoA hydratase/carnithine racemase